MGGLKLNVLHCTITFKRINEKPDKVEGAVPATVRVEA